LQKYDHIIIDAVFIVPDKESLQAGVRLLKKVGEHPPPQWGDEPVAAQTHLEVN